MSPIDAQGAPHEPNHRAMSAQRAPNWRPMGPKTNRAQRAPNEPKVAKWLHRSCWWGGCGRLCATSPSTYHGGPQVFPKTTEDMMQQQVGFMKKRQMMSHVARWLQRIENAHRVTGRWFFVADLEKAYPTNTNKVVGTINWLAQSEMVPLAGPNPSMTSYLEGHDKLPRRACQMRLIHLWGVLFVVGCGPFGMHRNPHHRHHHPRAKSVCMAHQPCQTEIDLPASTSTFRASLPQRGLRLHC